MLLDRSKSSGKLVTANAATVVPTTQNQARSLVNANSPKTEFMPNDDDEVKTRNNRQRRGTPTGHQHQQQTEIKQNKSS